MCITPRRSACNVFCALTRHHWFRLAAAATLTAVSEVRAQTNEARLLLGDLITQVQHSNPRIAAAQLLAQAAQTRVPSATRLPDPQLQFGFMNYTLPTLGPMPTVGMSQLQLMQMLPLGGKLALAGRVSAAQASAAGERQRDLSWEVRSAAAMAFYDLYAADRGLEIARETIRLLQDAAQTAETMYRVGSGRQADVLRAQVEIAKMAEDTIRMRTMRVIVAARINGLLDRDVDVLIGAPVLPRFPDSLPARTWLDSVSSTDRPVIRAGADGVRGAEASEALAKKDIWPDLQVGVQYAQRSGDMGTERMGSLMLGASIPVFARDRQLRMRDEATLMKRMAESDLAAMRAETRTKIGEAYANLERTRGLARLYRTSVIPQAEAAAASALAAYRVGTADFMALLEDRMTVNTYRQQLYALDAEQGKVWAELEMLTGHELVDTREVVTAGSPGGAR